MLAGQAPPVEPEPPPGGTPLTAALVAVWYAASVKCNQTTKVLVDTLGSPTLTLWQLLVAVACGALVLAGLRAFCRECTFPPVGIESRGQLADTAALSAIFTGGFGLLNAAFASMHVSLVMVLRAAEPLTTLALGWCFFGTSAGPRKVAMLLAVVAGCALSSAGAFQPTMAGVALASLANVCFSMRGLLGKRLAARYGGGDIEVFFQLCVLGALLQAAVLLGTSGTAAFGAIASLVSGRQIGVALVNGATFYAYLCLSWVCLGRMTAVRRRTHLRTDAARPRMQTLTMARPRVQALTMARPRMQALTMARPRMQALTMARPCPCMQVSHSVANSLRRPVTVLAALAYDPVPLAPENVAGIALACAAAAAYGLV